MACFKSSKERQRSELDLLMDRFELPTTLPQDQKYVSNALYVHITTLLIERLLSSNGVPRGQAALLAKRIKASSSVVLCILIRIGGAALTSRLLDESLTDAALPLEIVHADGAAELQASTGQRLHTLSTAMVLDQMEALVKKQWLFLSPSFDIEGGHCRHQQLHEMAVLPFLAESGSRKVSKRSWVAKFKVDASHIQWRDEEPQLPSDHTESREHGTHLVAVKCSLNDVDFHAEKALLAACKQRQHEHIVEMLASFSWRGNGHLMLVAAETDLESLWRHNTNSAHYSPTWALRQMRGLASALHNIHMEISVDGNKIFGLHGDIKASNVLFYRSESKDSRPGTLKLADFSTSLLSHDPKSIDNVEPRGLFGTHQPPECFLELHSSQKSDIWSMGCLLLEFLVWLHGGLLGFERFCKVRSQHDYGYGFEFTNDYFFELASPKNGREARARSITDLNAGVKDTISRLRASVQVPEFLELLNVIEIYLLQVAPENRWDAHLLFAALEQLAPSEEVNEEMSNHTSGD